jgi:hypothetical protein
MSTNNNNTGKSNNSSTKDLNKIYHFTDRWQKETGLFDKEFIINEEYLKNTRNSSRRKNKEVEEPRTWPHERKLAQIKYEQWLAQVSNPITGEFHPERDTEGNPIPQSDGRPNARYVIKLICRVRKANHEEYLTTQGQLRGYDSLGQLLTCPISNPEVWSRTVFKHERFYDPQSKNMYQTCKGPQSQEEVYDLPFSAENLQSILLDNPHNRLHDNLQLVVEVKYQSSVKESLQKESLKLFKEKDFDYLFNGLYIPPAIREEMRIRSAAMTGEENPQKPRIKSTNLNNPGYTLTTNYGTAKGLLDENINQEGVQRYHDKNTGYIG